MNCINFYEFKNHYYIPYSQKKYDEVLNLLNRSEEFLTKEEYEENIFNILIDKSRVYSELHDSIGCFNIINKSLEKSYAFPLYWPRFDFLKLYSEYQAVYALNEKLLKQAKENSRFKYEVHLPKSYNPNEKSPLFLSLHGDGGDGNIKSHSWYWKPDVLLKKGYIVVYLQSSQVYCNNYFGWLIDPILSRKEIKNCYGQLLTDYSIDEECVIIGGFSGGATTSLDITFKNVIPVKGCIALCPGGDLSNLGIDSTKKQTKIVILEGQYDTEPAVQDILITLKKFDVPYEYYLNKGISHSYPENLDEKTMQAIEFISKN